MFIISVACLMFSMCNDVLLWLLFCSALDAACVIVCKSNAMRVNKKK